MRETSCKNELDRRFMRRALALTRRGLGSSSPNPAVGAVVVKDGVITAHGVHTRAGQAHGEAAALAMAGEKARGATLYVTLEPCNHQGRTPPCTAAILKSGVKRVVFGARDPNPGVKGGGGDFLAQNGVEVEPGFMAAECAFEHRFFLTHIMKKRPHVILKTAATMDGRTATHTLSSRWVTGPASRRFVHRLRSWCDAICVGGTTALADDPSLTSRLPGGRDPLRVVVDTNLRLPDTAKVLNPESKAGCLIACGPDPDRKKAAELKAAGAKILSLPLNDQGRVDIAALLFELGGRGVTSLLLEGGAGLAWGFVNMGLVDEVMYFFAPKLVGGEGAPGMLAGGGVAEMSKAVKLSRPWIRRFGDDIMIHSMVG